VEVLFLVVVIGLMMMMKTTLHYFDDLILVGIDHPHQSES
jgi:hypothetical protein